MQESVWDPERISNIGWLLSRYSEHIQPSDRIKLGIEGDPCGFYRGVDDAPAATITHVSRDDSGFVKFTAVLDESNVEVELDNRNVSPEKVWEIHPDFVERFRGRVRGEDTEKVEEDPEKIEEEEEEDSDNKPVEHRNNEEDDFRSSVKTHVESLDERLKRMETAESELERTIASAVRELAGDLMRAYRGEEPEFAYRYADRYDLALTQSGTKSRGTEDEQEREEEEEDHRHDDEPTRTHDGFRGEYRSTASSSSSRRRPTSESNYRYQGEKDNFDLESLSFDVKESSVLSDDS